MKISENYILRNIADEYMLIPVGEAALKTKGLIRLSESGYFLYRKLKEGKKISELPGLLSEEYGVKDIDMLKDDVDAFLAQMRAAGIITD